MNTRIHLLGLRLTLISRLFGLAGLVICSAPAPAAPADLLADYRAQAGRSADPQQGQRFFNISHGREWSCASCHLALPSTAGRHAGTGKPIEALAPAFNPRRFSDPAKVEKWFRRNCKDVLSRECSAAEKADVLAWLITLKA